MVKSFLISSLLLVCLYSFRQTKTEFNKKEFDSLMSVWKDKTKADTLLLSAIGLYAWHKYAFSQPDSSSFYAFRRNI